LNQIDPKLDRMINDQWLLMVNAESNTLYSHFMTKGYGQKYRMSSAWMVNNVHENNSAELHTQFLQLKKISIISSFHDVGWERGFLLLGNIRLSGL
jgi:hypothetical protein